MHVMANFGLPLTRRVLKYACALSSARPMYYQNAAPFFSFLPFHGYPKLSLYNPILLSADDISWEWECNFLTPDYSARRDT
jgi:hypothetical protein